MNDKTQQEYEQRPYTEPQTHEEEMRRLVCKNIRRAVITIIIAVLAMILDIMVMIFSG